jgi:hypothetical protein
LLLDGNFVEIMQNKFLTAAGLAINFIYAKRGSASVPDTAEMPRWKRGLWLFCKSSVDKP